MMFDTNELSVEAVLMIDAISEDDLFCKLRLIQSETGLSNNGFDRYEEDAEGGLWTAILWFIFLDEEELETAIEGLEGQDYINMTSSTITLEGELHPIYSDGTYTPKFLERNEDMEMD